MIFGSLPTNREPISEHFLTLLRAESLIRTWPVFVRVETIGL
jgi:hypothetical protein